MVKSEGGAEDEKGERGEAVRFLNEMNLLEEGLELEYEDKKVGTKGRFFGERVV